MRTGRYRRREPQDQGEHRVTAFLHRIVVRDCRQDLRRSRQRFSTFHSASVPANRAPMIAMSPDASTRQKTEIAGVSGPGGRARWEQSHNANKCSGPEPQAKNPMLKDAE
jgi:DNA-directed RNA polymerase specialized sigma24 family protein